MKAGGRLTVERMVKLGWVSRSGFYRFDDTEPGPDADMDLRDAIQKIAVEWPSYGRPRVTRELRERGWMVNPKRVYRLMREDNLLCVRRRKFVVTTDSNHTRKVYPNLARDMVLTAAQVVAMSAATGFCPEVAMRKVSRKRSTSAMNFDLPSPRESTIDTDAQTANEDCRA